MHEIYTYLIHNYEVLPGTVRKVLMDELQILSAVNHLKTKFPSYSKEDLYRIIKEEYA